MLKPLLSTTLLLLFLTAPTHAQEIDNKTLGNKTLGDIMSETTLPEGAVRHAPEKCDFELTFPSAPHTAQRCPDGKKSCYDFTSYTMVYDVTTTIEISVTCVPSTPEQYKRYTEPVIATALKGMISHSRIENHEINTREEGDIRQGSLLGSAQRGKQNSIYNAQIWVGQNSIMTVESKLIGPFHSEADTIFKKILSSLKKREY